MYTFTRAVVLATAFFVASPFLSLATIVGSSHDFVDNGFTGGGACAACHIPHNAQDGRLWPRLGDSTTYPDSPRRLCMDCHADSVQTLAAIFTGQSEWAAVAVVPRPLPNGHANPLYQTDYEACTSCHLHSDAFVPNTNACLDCHTEGGPGGVPNIDVEFDNVGTLINPMDAQTSLLMSQHNIRYNPPPAGDLSTKADNECRKCHGMGHPNDNAFLSYPDQTVSHAYDEALPKGATFQEYEDFCLACHDGQDMGAANLLEQQFTGPVPPQQVPPTDLANPAAQQGVELLDGSPTAGFWQVAPVPQRDAAPYFGGAVAGDFYAGNGHGFRGVTCLAGGGIDGCHGVHGSKSRFLLYDNNARLGNLFPGPTFTIGEVETNFCLDCHIPGVTISGWHEFTGLHTGTFLWSGGASMGGMTQTGTIGIEHLPVGGVVTNILPFYISSDVTPENRIYRDATHPQVGVDKVHCPTCHDPHGTANTRTHNSYYETEPVDPTPTTQSMPRKTPVFWLADIPADPLCGECHVVE